MPGGWMQRPSEKLRGYVEMDECEISVGEGEEHSGSK